MSCLRTRQMLDGWLDGELDAGTSAALAQHTGGCPDCSSARHERERLRAALRALPRHTASAGFKRRLVAQLRAGASSRPADVLTEALPHTRAVHALRASWHRPRAVAWWQALGLAAASSAIAVLLTLLVVRIPGEQQAQQSAATLHEQLVSRHVASLSGGQLIQVASSDRHTIKPWLLGKADFAPQVRDLSAQGFILEGARLDQAGAQPAVAVVYKLRAHPVNLFVWRDLAAGGADAPRGAEEGVTGPQLALWRGFSIATWSAGGLRYAAVSDADAPELNRFAQAMLAR